MEVLDLEPAADRLLAGVNEPESAPSTPKRIWSELRSELKQMPRSERYRTVISGLGCGAMAGVGISQAPLTIAMTLPFRLSGHLPPFDAVESGALTGAWCYVDSKIFDNFFSRLPRTTLAIGGRSGARSANKLLHGLSPAENAPLEDTYRKSRLLGRLALHYSRGFAVQGIGSSAYMLAANVQGQTAGERSRLSRNIGKSSAVLIGSLAGAAALAANVAAHQDPSLSGEIMSLAGDQWFWLSASASLSLGMIGKDAIPRMARRLFGKRPQLEPIPAEAES